MMERYLKEEKGYIQYHPFCHIKHPEEPHGGSWESSVSSNLHSWGTRVRVAVLYSIVVEFHIYTGTAW